MFAHMFGWRKGFTLERRLPVGVDAVWAAWTRPERLRRWWGPENTTVTDCEVDPRVGGRIHVVMEAGAGMGKFQGTRWPMEGRFTDVSAPRRLTYQARSWTENGQATGVIEHVDDVSLKQAGGATRLTLRVRILRVGPGVKLASSVMKMGYNAHLDNLATALAADGHTGA